MYVPKHFEVTDRDELDAFIRRYSFATLVGVLDGAPFATHLPLVLDRSIGDNGALLGHLARANPHWHALDGAAQALAIFQGPHAYISPSWYESLPAVPTWNYTAVHVYATPRLMSDAELSDFVGLLTATYEADVNPQLPYQVPAEVRDGLLKGIAGFVLAISRVEGKYKLGQNRGRADQESVVANLPKGDELAAMMRTNLGAISS